MADGKKTDRKLVDPDANSPTMAQLRIARQELDKKMLELVTEFEQRFTVTIERVDLERDDLHSNLELRHRVLKRVRTFIRL